MIAFFVPGVPKPGGSKKAFYNKKLGRSLIVDASNNKDWRALVAMYGQQARGSGPLLEGPLQLTVAFWMPRPKNHFNSKGELKLTAPVYHTSKPDATKLLRCLEDALTNVVWNDDAQIAYQTVHKRYGLQPGARVWIEQLKENTVGNHEKPVGNAGA